MDKYSSAIILRDVELDVEQGDEASKGKKMHGRGLGTHSRDRSGTRSRSGSRNRRSNYPEADLE
ncbi:unnamed protein product, partial [Amoebophrya sp. A25]|eukprot:GSA25T00006834001.1